MDDTEINRVWHDTRTVRLLTYLTGLYLRIIDQINDCSERHPAFNWPESA